MTTTKLIRLPQVKERTGLPKSTIYRKIKERTFPQQISLGEKTVAWLESDIEHWINEKIQASNNNGVSLYEE